MARPDANADADADADRSKTICRPPLKGVDIITVDDGVMIKNVLLDEGVGPKRFPCTKALGLKILLSMKGCVVKIHAIK